MRKCWNVKSVKSVRSVGLWRIGLEKYRSKKQEEQTGTGLKLRDLDILASCKPPCSLTQLLSQLHPTKAICHWVHRIAHKTLQNLAKPVRHPGASERRECCFRSCAVYASEPSTNFRKPCSCLFYTAHTPPSSVFRTRYIFDFIECCLVRIKPAPELLFF